MHITRCYMVAAQFPACRERIIEMPQLIKDLCRILYFKVKQNRIILVPFNEISIVAPHKTLFCGH